MYGISYPTLNKRLKLVPDLKLQRTQKLIYPVDMVKILIFFGPPIESKWKNVKAIKRI